MGQEMPAAPPDLSADDWAMLRGDRGPTLQKAMRSVVLYGQAFSATHLVPITGAPHFVTSFGAGVIAPHLDMMAEVAAAGLRTARPYTVDPRPVDSANVPANLPERLVSRFVYGKQAAYERQLRATGLKDERAFTCACYLPQVGNAPARGEVLAWSESSAVVFANSVLGARSNRNSGGIDILCNVVGKAPYFGLLTDEGRRARWLIDVRTEGIPNAQVLGSAIGMKVVEDVPYVVGLDARLQSLTDAGRRDFLKDMGAASASNGAVGLYHAEGITPEAHDGGRDLLAEGYRTYVIDDAELARVMSTYPVLWRRRDAAPRLCFVGCPHLSLEQLHSWVGALAEAAGRNGRGRLAVDTVLCTAPDVAAAFRADGAAACRLAASGARLTSICPLMYMNNPLSARKPVITNSNKLRYYSSTRFFPDEQVLEIVATGRLPEEAQR